MKRLYSILIFILPSLSVLAQESETSITSKSHPKFFISTNSGVLKTPFGFRIGILDKMGGYIGTRFGKGYKYEEDIFSGVHVSKATLFAADAGFIIPIATRNTFKVRTFVGIGYGKWFDRPSKNGQTVGVELEGGLMLSYRTLILNLGGNMLHGDGNSPKGDMTVGLGFTF